MPDTYNSTQVARQSDPANGATLIDYSGGNQTVSGNARGIYITTAGNLKVDTARGDTVTLTNLVTGLLPLRVTLIYQTGSTAAGFLLF